MNRGVLELNRSHESPTKAINGWMEEKTARAFSGLRGKFFQRMEDNANKA